MIDYEKNVPFQDLGNGTGRRVMSHGGGMMAVSVDFTAGSSGAVHSHPHEQVSYCVSGRFLVNLGNEEYPLGPGDTFYCGPNEAHGVTCLEAGRLVDVFTPMREDFL